MGPRGHTLGTHAALVLALADRTARVHLARHPAARGQLDDLRQDVALALLVALPRWDPRRGALVTFLGRRADGAVLDATRSEMRRRPVVGIALPEGAALDPALARVDARLDAETVLSRLDARTADLLRRVYADGGSLRAAGRAAGVGQTRAHQIVRAGIEAARAAEGRE